MKKFTVAILVGSCILHSIVNERGNKMLYIFRIDWSQTDQEMVIVQASSREKAEAFLKRSGDRGPRYVTFYGSVEKPIKVME